MTIDFSQPADSCPCHKYRLLAAALMGIQSRLKRAGSRLVEGARSLAGHQRHFLGTCLSRSLAIAILLKGATVDAGDILWSSAGGSAWLTAGSWTGSAVPTATDNAQFGANPTSGTTGIGINGNGILVPGSQVEDV